MGTARPGTGIRQARWWIACCCLIVAATWSAQASATLQARWIRVHDELPVEGSLRLAQGPDRLLWIAGSAGLLRFDGVEFRPLPSLDGVPVRDLAFDRDGRLWIATADALYRARGLEIERLANLDPPLTDHVDLWPDAANGSVWLASPAGLHQWQGQARIGLEGASVEGYFYALTADSDGNLLAGGNSGLHRRDFAGHWQRVSAATELVYAIAPAGAGDIWAGGYRLHRVDATGRRTETVPGVEFVRVIATLSSGEVWVGTHGRGLWIRSPDGQWRQGERRLAGAMITAIFEDADGNVWVATEVGELHQFALVPMALVTVDEGLSGQLVAALASAANGTLWAAIYGVGLQGIGSDGRPLPTIDACQGEANSMAVDSGGALWVGGPRGLCRLDGERVVPSAYRDNVDAMLAVPDGIWIVSASRLRLWRSGRVVRDHGPFDMLDPGLQQQLLATGDGGLWIGNPRGLRRFDADGRMQPFLHQQPVRALLADGERGIWWLGHGVLGFVAGGQLAGNIDVESRLWLLAGDADDGLWLFGPRGALRYPRSALRATLVAGQAAPAGSAFGRAHGIEPIRDVGIGGPATAMLADGRIAIAGYGKLSIGRLEGAVATQAASVAELELRSRTGAPLTDVVAAADLPLTFAYTAASFRDAQRLQFRHRLWPIEQHWSAPSSLRQHSHAGLAAGRYRFEVQVLGAHGDAISPLARLEFEVLPRWHERADVRLLLGGIVLLTVALLLRSWLRWRLRRFAARQQELESVVAERTRQLAIANQELERLARTDALTGLLNRRGFEEAARVAWDAFAQGGSGFALVALDVDYFKAYNDRYGHAEGDACLRAVAQCLSGGTRAEGDIVARIGGEEFVVLLPGGDARAALRRAEELRVAVAGQALPHAGNPVAGVVTVSLGVALAGPGDHDREAVLARADGALYAAKGHGRNRVELAG